MSTRSTTSSAAAKRETRNGGSQHVRTQEASEDDIHKRGRVYVCNGGTHDVTEGEFFPQRFKGRKAVWGTLRNTSNRREAENKTVQRNEKD
jgi:hypothetical protein